MGDWGVNCDMSVPPQQISPSLSANAFSLQILPIFWLLTQLKQLPIPTPWNWQARLPLESLHMSSPCFYLLSSQRYDFSGEQLHLHHEARYCSTLSWCLYKLGRTLPKYSEFSKNLMYLPTGSVAVTRCIDWGEILHGRIGSLSHAKSIIYLRRGWCGWGPQNFQTLIQGGPKTGTRPTFCDNFGKCTPIFIILSPADSLVNLQ